MIRGRPAAGRAGLARRPAGFWACAPLLPAAYVAEPPSRSVRTTPIAAMTNSHSTARKASLMMVRESSLIGACLTVPRSLGVSGCRG